MALAALICAYRDTHADDGVLRATLMLAGRTLLERQARQAARAGAVRIVVLVERMPPALIAAIDRLKADGLPVVTARSPDEAAEAVDGSDRLLLVGDGFVGSQHAYDGIATSDGMAVAIHSDTGDERFERIDADSRWAGLAASTGALLRETTAMLRDWDLQSTLLRRIVQADARRVEAEPTSTIVEAVEDLAAAENKLLAGAGGTRTPGVAERMMAPVEQALLPFLAPRQVPAGTLLLFATGLIAIAAVLGAFGYLFAGLLLMLLAQPAEGLASRLAAIRLDAEPERSWAAQALPVLAGAALLTGGYALTATFGWGALLLAVVTLAFLFALRVELSAARPPHAQWLASRHLLPWALLPFGLFGQWLAGFALLFALAALSFFWTQYHVHGTARRDA